MLSTPMLSADFYAKIVFYELDEQQTPCREGETGALCRRLAESRGADATPIYACSDPEQPGFF
jgi:hypothetical protein